MTIPKRHHFVPRMILNEFTDDEGWLYWCRHRENPGTVRRARPHELFHKNHLYSTLSESGIKDPAMEHSLSVLESEAAEVVDAIMGSARTGRVPELSDQQKRVWYRFFLMQWRRTPETQLASASEAEALLMVEEIIAELRIAAPHRLAEIEKLAMPEAKARTVRNVRVQSLQRFSAEAISVLERRGIAVLRITAQSKSFIIGSRPVVKLTAKGRTDLNDPFVEMWLPIASDIAVGTGNGECGVTLHMAQDGDSVRQLNLAIAKQSRMIAAGSAALVRSLANAR